MAIGNLDRRIKIQDFTTVQNEFGETARTWVETAEVWGGVKYKSGGESVFATKETETSDVIFTIRYRSGITGKTRIVFEDEVYDIQHIAYVGRRKYMDITAKKSI